MLIAAPGVAIGLAVALAANSLLETLFDNHYWFQVRRLELRAKVTPATWCPPSQTFFLSYLMSACQRVRLASAL